MGLQGSLCPPGQPWQCDTSGEILLSLEPWEGMVHPSIFYPPAAMVNRKCGHFGGEEEYLGSAPHAQPQKCKIQGTSGGAMVLKEAA